MTAQEIMAIIEAGEFNFYGIRADRAGIEVGETFENSHQWYQDDPSDWGEECEFNEDMDMWDGGELDGVCTIGIKDFPELKDIEAVLDRAAMYDGESIYLVGGNCAEGGNDIGESIILAGKCLAIIK